MGENHKIMLKPQRCNMNLQTVIIHIILRLLLSPLERFNTKTFCKEIIAFSMEFLTISKNAKLERI